jgi:hypothetical protein
MFGWFRPKQDKPRELSFDVIADIMEKYGALLEKYPTAFVDESLLPLPKDEMRSVLRAAWKVAPDPQLRNAIEVGWASLSKFQPNVGPVPIDANPHLPKMLDRFVEIGKVAAPEMDRDFEELKAFKRDNNPS